MSRVSLRAGELRHSIAIQLQASGKDTRGNRSGAWAEVVADVPAAIEAMSGREREQSQQQYASATHKIKIRYYSGLTTLHRFVFRGRNFNIGHIDNLLEQDAVMICLCSEGKPDG